jgi:4-diphosphocytidyl-2-C-methyl-D-erythritol kinase
VLPLPGPDYPAPAKLNLFLHVVGRRADGYHLLQSVFTLIDRADRLRFRVRRDGLVARVNDVAGVPAEEDLTVRAALLLKEASGTPLGADIEIEKHIPMGAGLGGGSSDAATTLIVLDRLWETGFGPEALAELASGLGADIPFFLPGGAAWAEGTGDELRAIELPPRWYVVLTPPVHVPTREVFAAPELTRDTEPLKMEDFSARPRSKSFVNDLEPVVTARYPVVLEYLDWLRRRAPARMTGSGACVFAEFDSRERAQAVADELPATMRGFVAQGLMQHPLRRQ